jgi:3-hydroxyisobutyrate dehydrogenase-like beta-hydroxyacid dehydrogenase
MMTKAKQAPASVGIIGLGAMGTAIAKTLLLNKSYRVTVWNRTPEKASALTSEGAIHAETVEQAIANSEKIIVCVLNYEIVNELLLPLANLLAGKTIINLTNGTPMQAKATAEYVNAAGAYYVDGGIMAVPPMIGQEHALILCSGAADAWEQSETIVRELGTAQYMGDDIGLAALCDLALLTAMYGMFSGYLQAITMVSSANIKARDFTPMVIQWLQAMMHGIPPMAEEIDAKDYGAQVVSALDMQNKAFVNLTETYKELGMPAALLSPLKDLMEKAVARGYGKDNLSALFEVLKIS